MADQVGQADLRAENFSKVVTGFALQEFKIKPLCMIKSSSAWKESYYQETATDLTGGAGSAIEDVPRLAQFPNLNASWTLASSYQKKHAGEATISIEDMRLNEIDVVARTLLRVSRGIAKSVDDDIWDVITENRSPTNINSVSITAGSEWDSATIANRDPIQNILDAIKEISEENYDPLNGNGFLIVSPKDFSNLMGNANVRNAGQFYTSGVTENGRIGKLLGLNVIVSNSVTADYALVGIAKECATYQEAFPLTVVTIENKGISETIRAWEIGITQLTNPKALCLISNTQA